MTDSKTRCAYRMAGMAVVAVALVAAPDAARAEYLFSTPTAKNQNRIYWLDRYTGTVGACQYQSKGGPNGTMLCFAPGDGARDMPSGDYDLLPSSWDSEWGLFRVNRTTGEVALCYIKDDKVVCTPQTIAR